MSLGSMNSQKKKKMQSPVELSRGKKPMKGGKIMNFFWGTKWRKITTTASVTVISLLVIGYATGLFGAIGELQPSEESKIATFSVNDGHTGEPFADEFTLTAYVPDVPLINVTSVDNLTLFKEWKVGVNGSADTASLEFDITFHSATVTAYFIHFTTDLDVYKNWSSFWYYITKGGKYAVQVYQDPEETNIDFYDMDDMPISLPDGMNTTEFYMDLQSSLPSNTSWKALFDLEYSSVHYKGLVMNLTLNDTYVPGDVSITDAFIADYGVVDPAGIISFIGADNDTISLFIPSLKGTTRFTVEISKYITITSVTLQYGDDIIEAL